EPSGDWSARLSAYHDPARQAATSHANQRRGTVQAAVMRGNPPMRMLAYVLAIICVIAAVMYFTMAAGSLPTFMPGYVAGSSHIHTTHAIAAAVAAVVLFLIGWF